MHLLYATDWTVLYSSENFPDPSRLTFLPSPNSSFSSLCLQPPQRKQRPQPERPNSPRLPRWCNRKIPDWTARWCDTCRQAWRSSTNLFSHETHVHNGNASLIYLEVGLTWTPLAAQSLKRRWECRTAPGRAWAGSSCPRLPRTAGSYPEPAAASAACRWAGTCPPPRSWCCTAAAGCCQAAESPAAWGSPEGKWSQTQEF